MVEAMVVGVVAAAGEADIVNNSSVDLQLLNKKVILPAEHGDYLFITAIVET
jgi:hypothetical protein